MLHLIRVRFKFSYRIVITKNKIILEDISTMDMRNTCNIVDIFSWGNDWLQKERYKENQN